MSLQEHSLESSYKPRHAVEQEISWKEMLGIERSEDPADEVEVSLGEEQFSGAMSFREAAAVSTRYAGKITDLDVLVAMFSGEQISGSEFRVAVTQIVADYWNQQVFEREIPIRPSHKRSTERNSLFPVDRRNIEL